MNSNNTMTELKTAALKLMMDFINQYQGTGFGSVISLGDLATYQSALDSVDIKVDANQEALGLYQPKSPKYDNPTITLSLDPATVKPEDTLEYRKLGKTIWHEVTHRIEDIHGDFGLFVSKLKAERNAEYMEAVAENALYILERAEKLIEEDPNTSTQVLIDLWKQFIRAMADARLRLQETKEYLPDLELMKEWFGFEVDINKIRDNYASGVMGEAFQEMIEQVKECDWSGSYDTTYGKMELVQTGDNVSGSYAYEEGRIEGTAEGNMMFGTWSEAPTFAGDWDAGPFQFTISEDCGSFSGVWRHNQNELFSYRWSGVRIKPPTIKPVIQPEKEPVTPAAPEVSILGRMSQPLSYATEDFGIWGITGDVLVTVASDGSVTAELINIKRNYDEAWVNYDFKTSVTSIEPKGNGIAVNVKVEFTGLPNKVSWYKWEDRKWGPASENVSTFERSYSFFFENISGIQDYFPSGSEAHYEGPLSK